MNPEASPAMTQNRDAGVPQVVPLDEATNGLGHMRKISNLIEQLTHIRDAFGDTCVYIRRGGLSWGAVALNWEADDAKHGVFDVQAKHDRDMQDRADQVERLIKDRNEWRDKALAALPPSTPDGGEAVGWRYRPVGAGQHAPDVWLMLNGPWPEAWGLDAWEREPLYAHPQSAASLRAGVVEAVKDALHDFDLVADGTPEDEYGPRVEATEAELRDACQTFVIAIRHALTEADHG